MLLPKPTFMCGPPVIHVSLKPGVSVPAGLRRFRQILKKIVDTKQGMGKTMRESAFALTEAKYAAGDIKATVFDSVETVRPTPPSGPKCAEAPEKNTLRLGVGARVMATRVAPRDEHLLHALTGPRHAWPLIGLHTPALLAHEGVRSCSCSAMYTVGSPALQACEGGSRGCRPRCG